MRMGSKLRNVIASLLLAAPVVSCTSAALTSATVVGAPPLDSTCSLPRIRPVAAEAICVRRSRW